MICTHSHSHTAGTGTRWARTARPSQRGDAHPAGTIGKHAAWRGDTPGVRPLTNIHLGPSMRANAPIGARCLSPGGCGHICLLAPTTATPAPRDTALGAQLQSSTWGWGSRRGPPHLPEEGLGKFLPCWHPLGLFPTHTARGSCTHTPTLRPGMGPIPPPQAPTSPQRCCPCGEGAGAAPCS